MISADTEDRASVLMSSLRDVEGFVIAMSDGDGNLKFVIRQMTVEAVEATAEYLTKSAAEAREAAAQEQPPRTN